MNIMEHVERSSDICIIYEWIYMYMYIGINFQALAPGTGAFLSTMSYGTKEVTQTKVF